MGKISKDDLRPQLRDEINGLNDKITLNKQNLEAHEADNVIHGKVLAQDNNFYTGVINEDANLSLKNITGTIGDTITNMVIDEDFVYVTGHSTVKQIKKFSKQDITAVVASSPTLTDIIQNIAIDDNYIYIICQNERKIRKYNKSDLSYVGISSSVVYLNSSVPIGIDENYLYGANSTDKITKINKNTLEVVETASTNYNNGVLQRLVVPDGDYLYITAYNDKKIVKLRKSDLSYITETPIPYNGIIYAMTTDDDYVYIGGDTSFTVQKLNKSDLSLVAESSSQGGAILTLAVDDTSIFVGGTAITTINKLDKQTLSTIARTSASHGSVRIIRIDNTVAYIIRTTTLKIMFTDEIYEVLGLRRLT